MTGWLDPLRAALDAAEQPCTFFFRDDDAGWADDRLWSLLDRFERRDVRVDVAVIPAELTPALAGGLRARVEGGTVHLHQHGLAHVNHETEGRKHEFGSARDLAHQRADIATGWDRLAGALGDCVEKIFTPPWNRCTEDTGQALADLGFRALSRDRTAKPFDRPDLPEIPINLDWFGHRRGLRWTADELGRRLAEGVDDGGPVGVMLHHEISDEAEQSAIEDLLTVVGTHPMARSVSMRELV